MGQNSNTTRKVIDDRYAEAGEALEPYRGVVISDAGIATYPATVGARIDGVTLRGAAAGEPVQIVTDGRAPIQVSASASVAKNAKLRANTVGKFAIVATGNAVSAIALESAGAADDVVQARISLTIQETA